MNKKINIVITTIREKNDVIANYEKIIDGKIILIGDKKSKKIEKTEKINFYSLGDQLNSDFKIAKILPFNHYSRKNIGYLYSILEKAELVFDTDDDNNPNTNWKLPPTDRIFSSIIDKKGFFNVYRYFSDEFIWPRGLPLDQVDTFERTTKLNKEIEFGTIQSLVDGDPDVDAIHRMLFKKQFYFKHRAPLAMDAGVYVPFNSQSTIWINEMLPYAYLPSTVSFRFTDILRGYIAQRCFWEHGKRLVFSSPIVNQLRNEHDLLDDFKDEIPCHLNVRTVVELLDNLSLSNDFENNLIKIYTCLSHIQVVKSDELKILRAWLDDINFVFGK